MSNLFHPYYSADNYIKWRLAFKGGSDFINRYLKKYSNREDQQDFNNRKAISYCPAFAKAGVNEIKNSIFQRMVDISRIGGSNNYQKAMAGELNGVDDHGNSMNSFMGKEVLPELLVVSKVGIYVDMPNAVADNLRDAQNLIPYIYTYKVEDIINWDSDKYNSVYLRDTRFKYDEYTGFATGLVTAFRKTWKDDNGDVWVQTYDDNEKEDSDPLHLKNLTKIPFIMSEISASLMEDVADYQIALLNVASSDISYAVKSNFPFYVEQYDPRAESSKFLKHQQEDSESEEVDLGVTTGRRYVKGMDAPGFINPSSEPLVASMAKQNQLKEEIRLLLNLSLTNIKTVGAVSAASKDKDQVSLESGLANIGLTLEKTEREIARIWSEYEGNKDIPSINYPVNYSLRTSRDRLDEADTLNNLLTVLPSKTYQTEIGKQIARVMLNHTVNKDTIARIDAEINAAPNMVSNPDIIAKDVENGLVSPETGSKLRGYPADEAEKAKIAHAERLARITAAQTPIPTNTPVIKDTEGSSEFKDQKAESRETDQDDVVTDKTRGEGR
jgi:hypothetical protein